MGTIINHKSGIYSIQNIINNKIYIGQSKSLTTRWRQHKSDLKYGRHKNIYLQRSFDEYGLENFKYVQLEECSEYERDNREIYWINFFKSNEPEYGYNLKGGGNSLHSHSEETKKKLSEINKSRPIEMKLKFSQINIGRKLSQEHKNKISKSLKELPQEIKDKATQARIGKKRSEETKQKMSNSKKGIPSHNKGKHLTDKWKENIRKSNLGKKRSEETKQKISRSKLGKPTWNTGLKLPSGKESKSFIPATKEMLFDIENGISRKKFKDKYNHVGIWIRERKNLKIS